MRILLDTSAFLWCIQSPEHLSNASRQILADLDSELLLSIASVWEMAIKVQLGKLRLIGSIEDIIDLGKVYLFIKLLPIDVQHVIHTGQLPMRHRDPFDRLLIAQATIENLPIMTSDHKIAQYAVQVLW